MLPHGLVMEVAANEGGFSFLGERREMRAEMAKIDDKIKKLESHRQSHLDLQKRAISTWARDAFNSTLIQNDTSS